jgi:hypothetical protein
VFVLALRLHKHLLVLVALGLGPRRLLRRRRLPLLIALRQRRPQLRRSRPVRLLLRLKLPLLLHLQLPLAAHLLRDLGHVFLQVLCLHVRLLAPQSPLPHARSSRGEPSLAQWWCNGGGAVVVVAQWWLWRSGGAVVVVQW